MNNRPSSIRVFGSSLVADPYTPQFRAYVYGGDVPLEKDPEIHRGSVHGTPTAARLHYTNKEPLCDACRESERARWREDAKKRKKNPADRVYKTEFTSEKCGTNAGHQRHMYYGITPCDDCIAAHREYQQVRRAKRRAADKAKKEAAA